MVLEYLEKINHNGYEVLTATVLANLIAQILKTIINGIKQREMKFSVLISTGGMPSSHSSTVTAMAFSVGLISGWSSVDFAITCCIASIVMYDAAGVRRAASRQAWVLNRIIKEIFAEGHTLKTQRLKELLGHSPTEVLAGAVLGCCIAYGLRALIVSYGL